MGHTDPSHNKGTAGQREGHCLVVPFCSRLHLRFKALPVGLHIRFWFPECSLDWICNLSMTPDSYELLRTIQLERPFCFPLWFISGPVNGFLEPWLPYLVPPCFSDAPCLLSGRGTALQGTERPTFGRGGRASRVTKPPRVRSLQTLVRTCVVL